MNNQNPVIISPPNSPNQQQQQQNPVANYQFSPDELRVLKECNRESLFQRSVPFGTGLGLLAWYAVKNGFLSPSARFGSGPKVLFGVAVGYFAGKISYQQKCAEKLMKLPNSRLGELLRQKKQGGMYERFANDGNISLGPFSSKTPDVYTDEPLKPNSSMDLDLNRPQTYLDDMYSSTRQNLDDPTYEDNLPLEPPKNKTSYDELRKKNREEFEKKQQNPFNRPLPRDAPIVTREPEPREPKEDQFEQRGGQKNKYGDVWIK